MSLQVIKAGLQTTLQSVPFRNHRHIGMAASGAADSLSLALANRLVGNKFDDAALEIPLSGASFSLDERLTIALTGAYCDFRINGDIQPLHKSICVSNGAQINIGPAQKGCRSYLAISAEFDVDTILGTKSTFPPASLGGFQGRILRDGDILPLKQASIKNLSDVTPDQFVPTITDRAILRVTDGPEFSHLTEDAQYRLFQNNWQVDQRMSRMGLLLSGAPLETKTPISMQSCAVFPGTVQCPPSGKPFLLGPDAQTTGGYSRVLQVIRADRHLIGQLRPGSNVQLIRIQPEQATRIYRKKLELLMPWLGNCQLW